MRRLDLLLLIAMIMTLMGCGPSDDRIKAKNIDVVHVVFSEVWSRGSVDLIDELYGANFVGHFPAGTFYGLEGIRGRVIAEQDRVVARFTSRGTNLGNFLNKMPTGNRIEISEVAISRLKDGKIVEQWVYPDMLSMQRRLGQKE